MIDSNVVLQGQTLAYTFYCIVIILLMAWFGFKITTKAKSTKVSPALFYTFVAFLTVLGVSLHIVTYNTIPWVELDMKRGEINADKTFTISVENHKFNLPEDKLLIELGEIALFDVTSNDLTYGFGVFREDNTMVFQMQVVPGHRNDIMWKFEETGKYTIRSTEYSGPKGIAMIIKNAIVVLPNPNN